MFKISKEFYDMCVSVADNAAWIVLGILVIAILVVGVTLMVSDDPKTALKKRIPWICVGVGAALSPVVIAEAISNAMKF